ncbi:alpha-amylase family glycosyl hydrolase [Haploplasma modicum]|uniref:alpha-amylase family glycosyl hydrolase n=1 Tax=Haploplasma modicum TaxID=2150 RepID=UPI00214B8843|nr:alpha-amylase family glycosyl hydrolase [Haploplasma modicum]MCR1808937.1 alpha-amylase family glycosyl hydrolase [Haploplasma modicum]
MALNTNINLRNKSIYQVFIRQHSKTGDFKGLLTDLDRIKNMGFDIVYLLPFHPIGKISRKGSIGSPYSIVNYYEIDENIGNLEDLILLKKEVNKRGMDLMMDIVFNHTSRDSYLVKHKPEWFYKNENGLFANRVGDWSDITDLDLNNLEVREYLIDVLKYWAKYVDGFRCDVAPLLPIDFWSDARLQVNKVNENILWLTESVELSFIKYIRDLGFDASSDSQMYDVFDVCYDYDIFKYMDNYLDGSMPLNRWLTKIIEQESIYPKNYVKLRSFENHDQARIASKAKNKNQLINLTAMQFFIKGMPMIYAGQEHQIKHRPDLFETDLIMWDENNSIEDYIKTLNEIKKDLVFKDGIFNLEHENEAVFSYLKDHTFMLGIFNLENSKSIKVPLKDGLYLNLINNDMINIKNNLISDYLEPIIIKTEVINKI